MAHPYASQAKSGSASKFKALTGKKSGGAVHGEGQQKTYAKGGPVKTNEYKVGGTVSAPNFARGGRSKGKGKHGNGTHINIAVVAPHGKCAPEDAGAPPLPGLPPGMPPPGMGPKPPMAMPPPGGPGAGGPPPGMPPGLPGMKSGGTVRGQGSNTRKYTTVPVGAGGGNFRKTYSKKMKKEYP